MPGTVKIYGDIQLPEASADRFSKADGSTLLELPNGGTVEMQNNKIILLAD
jgi:F-type H+-transporting ATPase subunit epsilon